jgi:surfactin synthase thioesterase subunit
MKLFCFHHAGGEVSAFSGWQRALGPAAEVVPVRLPGRDRTGRSPRYRDLTSLVRALADDLGPKLSGPHLFYGHSMGALVAYRLTRERLTRGAPPPERLLVGAFPAPHLPPALCELESLPDTDVVRLLMGSGGIPEALLDAPEWVRRKVVLLRADISICESGADDRNTRNAVPLPCPVEVFAGTEDPLLSVADAAAWSAHTQHGCTLHSVPGGHFFPRESKDLFFAGLRAALARAERRRDQAATTVPRWA